MDDDERHRRKMADRAEARLREWARVVDEIAQGRPPYAPGYPPVSQMHRACTEGAQGMLSKGPPSDGGMVQALQYMEEHVRLDAEVRQVTHIVSRMPKGYRDVIRAAYLSEPGRVLARRKAAEAVGITEREYRDRWAAAHAYVAGALDSVAA